MEIACTAVQKLVRSRISRKAYQNTKSAIIKLQALARLKTKRQRFLQQRKAAIRVQTEQRRRVGRKEANARRRVLQAVLAIQRWSIGCLARLQRRTLLATILIQRWTRVCLSALELRRLAAADVIQRWSRNRTFFCPAPPSNVLYFSRKDVCTARHLLASVAAETTIPSTSSGKRGSCAEGKGRDADPEPLSLHNLQSSVCTRDERESPGKSGHSSSNSLSAARYARKIRVFPHRHHQVAVSVQAQSCSASREENETTL